MRLVIIFLSLFCLINASASGFGEDYYKLKSDEKRAVFFDKMSQMLDTSFAKIKAEREFVINFLQMGVKMGFRFDTKMSKSLAKLHELKAKYRIENLLNLEEYKLKIAPIPKSMAMAQALLESGTGTSRFAREANNLFGEWTWSERGLVPDNRPEGKTHKIRVFDSLQDSVDSYVLNLNRHFAYENFRKKRAEYEALNKHFGGLEAILSLESYSELKERYTNRITSIIKRYKLDKYDISQTQSPLIKR